MGYIFFVLARPRMLDILGRPCDERSLPPLLCFAIQLVGLFDEVDDDHDGYLHYTEFLAATLETDGREVTDERLAEAFDQLDMDDSGFISKENLVEFLGKDSKVRRLPIAARRFGTCQPGVMFIDIYFWLSHGELCAPPLKLTLSLIFDGTEQLPQTVAPAR